MDHLYRESRFTTSDTPAALVVAHPGHELRVHGWLEMARPRVFVLTDGSGRSGRSRLASTTRILERAGAKLGCIYGRLTDHAVYSAILDHSFDLFIGLAEELADALVCERTEYVAGDAVEGYNPEHDACRLIITAAVEIVKRAKGQHVANYDFLLLGQPNACPDDLRAEAIWLELDDAAFARKLAAARAYPELAGEVDIALRETQVDAFRIECLRPVPRGVAGDGLAEEAPFYERYGEKQVAAGYYDRVLRRHEHMIPLAEALWCYVEKAL
jgi:hypothetical protein